MTLADEMIQQLASRTNGSDLFTGPIDGSNHYRWPVVVNKHFWLRDVTNILAQSQWYQANGLRNSECFVTAVAPHFCIAAKHMMGIPFPATNVWVRPDGSYYTNVTLSVTNVIGDIDLCFMQFTNWTSCKVLPDARSKFGFWQKRDPKKYPIPVFVRFHQVGDISNYHTTFVSGSLAQGIFAHHPGQFAFGDYTAVGNALNGMADRWISGDSSGAAYAIINNEAVFVGCAFTPSYCPPVGLYTNQINATMAAVCKSHDLPTESLTLYNLDQFPDQQVKSR